MNGSVFPALTLNRRWSRWEQQLYTLTPVHELDGVAFKRDDWFAPLGYGGINGGKVRQLTWLLNRQAAAGCKGVLYGCSVLSDVSARLTLTARHYGLPTHLVLGATHYRSAVKHENIAISDAAGAQLRFIKVAYNPQLQRETARLIDTPDYRGWYKLNYGVAPADDVPDDEFEAFYGLTARQVDNLPGRRTLVVPAGSCNTAVSVIYGLAQRRPAALERLVLVAVGPDRRAWLERRLRRLQRISGVPVMEYLRGLDVQRHDLHGSGFARYADKMPWRVGSMDFHPTYEGKLMTFFKRRQISLEDTTVWVVGSQPSRMAMLDAFQVDGLPIDWAIKGKSA